MSRSGRSWPEVRGGRGKHRRAADAEAHGGSAAVPRVIDHPLVPGGGEGADVVEVVQTPQQLAALVAELREAGRFAFDTEFIGEDSYYARFCLVQVATPDRIWLIDPLAEGLASVGRGDDAAAGDAGGGGLRPFWELLAEPADGGAGPEVIVHAGLQDLEPVARLIGRPVGRVFDTQIAAAFVGMPYPMSLTKLCDQMLGADLGGSSKFSQWDRRPLSARQRAYAANDVRYLLWLRDEVGRGLESRGHVEKVWSECDVFKDPSAYRVDPRKMKLKAKGAGSLRRREQAVAEALLVWRAGEAQARDLPMRTVVDDATLVELARQPVQSVAEVKKFKGVPWPVKEQCAETLVEVTAAALAGPMPKRRRYKPLGEAAEAKLAELSDAVREACEAVDIAPAIAYTRRDLTELVRSWDKRRRSRAAGGDAAKRAGGAGASDARLHQGWRGQVLGGAIRAVLGEPGDGA